MESYMIPFNVRDALLCLMFLVAMVVSGVAIVRHNATAGWLAVGAFAVMALDPIVEFVLFQVVTTALANSGTDTTVFNWVYACISSLVITLGVGMLVAALYIATRPVTAPNRPM